MDANLFMRMGICTSLYAYRDFSVTHRMHAGNVSIWDIRSSIPICIISHTGIAVCIWGSPYANEQGSLKYSHMGIPLHIMKLCAGINICSCVEDAPRTPQYFVDGCFEIDGGPLPRLARGGK